MKLFNTLPLSIVILLATGCSTRFEPKVVPKPVIEVVMPPKVERVEPVKPIKRVIHSASLESAAYNRQVHTLRKKASRYWGKKTKVASRYELVQYMDDYKARASINFRTNKIYVETTVNKTVLKKAIMTTLLSPENPEDIDLFSSRDSIQKGVPFLFGRIKDHEGKVIRWRWRAEKFAEYLIQRRLKVKSGKLSVSFDLADNTFMTAEDTTQEGSSKATQKGQDRSYKSIVQEQARRFGVSSSLILALIETESHFNPYATSAIPAYGLMQVVPSSAGKDAWELVKKRKGTPTRNYLFNAKNNIELGTAYVHIILNRYLDKVKDPKSRELCAIAAYNTGSGNVLRSFSKNRRRAFQKINALTPTQVLRHLKRHLPYAETRRYVTKVTQAKKRY